MRGGHLSEEEDSVSWRHSPDEQYSLRSSYTTLSAASIQLGGKFEAVVDPLDLIWHSWAPSKVHPASYPR